jgi:hypothetical protein
MTESALIGSTFSSVGLIVVRLIDSPNNQAAKSAEYCSIRNFEMLSITGRALKKQALTLYFIY